MHRVLVTGANGFIGRALVASLARDDVEVCAALRQRISENSDDFDARVSVHVVGDVGPATDWTAALGGVQTVVHLAARVHVMQEKASDPLTEFRNVNTHGTIRLASMAAQAGVRRLVYVSTIKVNGEATVSGSFREDDPPRPSDPYAISKWEAEQALLKIADETGLEVAIVRPPLVYGPGVGGNFLRMMDWIKRGFALPLGSIRNSRSLIYLGNLVGALVTCVTHPHAAGKTFLVSDGEDVSTPELIRRLAQAMERRPRLLPFPPALLRFAGLLTAKSAEVERLLGSLCVDSAKIRRELQWTPPFSMTQGLRETAIWYSGAFD